MVGKDTNYATNISVDDEKDMDVNGSAAGLGNNAGLEPAARSANALWKRAEQLKRWEESETNRENPNPLRGGVAVSWSILGGCRGKVKFPDECVFLAACASGDVDEVERLLEHGADINTTNVDGMTALHQAVIDQNLDVVQYLVENGADIDAQDNEGWTPLMAGVSCDFMDIVRYLLDKGADPTLVNSDGELPLDLTDSPQMRSLLQQEISRRGMELEDARHREEQLMMRDALELLNSRVLTKDKEKRHPRTGATALHVAASKGYIKVLNILLQAGSDVNSVDFEAWTPLHAAAHWGERQACEILVEHMADMDAANNAKQTCFDVADSEELCQALAEMKKKQEQIKKEHKPFESLIERQLPSRQAQEYKVRKNSITRISTDSKKNLTKSDETKEAEALRTASSSEASDTEYEDKKVEGRQRGMPSSTQSTTSSAASSVTSPMAIERKRQDATHSPAAPSKLAKLDSKEPPAAGSSTPTTTVITTSVASPLASVSVTVVEPTRSRQATAATASTTSITATGRDAAGPPSKLEEGKIFSPVTQSTSKPTHGPPVIVSAEPPTPPWRLTGRRGIHPSTPLGGASSENGSPSSASTRITSPQSPGIVSVQVTSSITPTPSKVTVVSAPAVPPSSSASEGVRWRQNRFEKTASLDDNERSCSKLPWVRACNQPTATSPPWSQLIKTRPSNSSSPATASPSPLSPPSIDKRSTPALRNQQTSSMLEPVAAWIRPVSSAKHSNVSTNAPSPRHAISEPASSSPFRLFAPPQRSEESEAERKVRAKRERESRRSTQGVTLETVKMAEQIHGNVGMTGEARKGTATSEEEKTTSARDQTADSRQSHKVRAGDTKETVAQTNKATVERPATIDITGPAKFSASSTLTPTPSLYPWKATGRVAANENGSDAANKADPLAPKSDKGGSKASSVVSPPPFLKRFQSRGQDERTSQSAATDASSSSVLTAASPASAATTVAPSAVTSPSAAMTISAHIPNRKRLRNARRSTGPVAQEDIHLALETDQEGQMTGEDDGSLVSTKETNAGGAGGDQKGKPGKMNATVIPVGGVENVSPMTERKSAFAADASSQQQSNVSHRPHSRHLKSENVPATARPASAGGATVETSMELDYKKLYEREKAENDRLLDKIKYLENLIESTRMIGAKVGSGDPIQPLSDRERRTLEKRISQLEEETKVIEQLRSDNQRLKEENGALIRVISKLSK